ncbi:methyltransferase domain-containing protein [Streptomyces sp. NPDC026294]|uniref:methyltransferase domain-containing protein n=1 Tax=Streptomyces sp. NPDC026294 TaxID=3155362 RepID=UPI0033D1B766
MTGTTKSYDSSYLGHSVDTELDRLRTLERAFDTATFSVLADLDLPQAARCLDLGAGAGSVAAWLADRYPAGRVTATDTDTRFLDFPPSETIEVLRHDAAHDDFPAGTFDLVHTRALLSHLPDRDRVLRRAASWVRPGGWLVVEDLSVAVVDNSPHLLLKQVTSAGEELLRTAVGTDLRWAETMPDALRDLGLKDVQATVTPGVIGDDSATHAFWKATVDQATPSLLQLGLVTSGQIDALYAMIAEPGFTDVGIAMTSARARKPR